MLKVALNIKRKSMFLNFWIGTPPSIKIINHWKNYLVGCMTRVQRTIRNLTWKLNHRYICDVSYVMNSNLSRTNYDINQSETNRNSLPRKLQTCGVGRLWQTGRELKLSKVGTAIKHLIWWPWPNWKFALVDNSTNAKETLLVEARSEIRK